MLRPLTAGAIVAACSLLGACAAHDATAPRPTVASPSAGPSTSAPTPSQRPTTSPREVVVGLGDSVTAGSNCSCVTFPRLYAAGLPPQAGGPGRAVNLGIGGETTTSLARRLQTAAVANQVAGADVILVTIGANDLVPLIARFRADPSGCRSECYGPAVSSMGAGLDTVLAEVDSLRSKSGSRVLVTDYWNVFQDGDVGRAMYPAGYPAWSDAVTRAANLQICSTARAHDDACVDLYRPFKGDGDTDDTALLAPDGDHPNAAGHALIARTLLGTHQPSGS